MSVRIQLRRDTAANWTSVNPILAAGEEGFETDTGKRKVGDGATAWNSLVYNGSSSTATGEIWTSLSGAYASSNTFTAAGVDKHIGLMTGSLFTCTDSAGTTRRYGFIKSVVNNSGTLTITTVTTTALAATDKDFKVSYNLKIFQFQHNISIPGQVSADTTNSVGLWKLNLRYDSVFISSDCAAITPPAGSGAAMTWQIFAGSTALYGTAPDLGTNSSIEDQRPTTVDVAKGSNMSGKIMSVGGTTIAADVQITITVVPKIYYTAF